MIPALLLLAAQQNPVPMVVGAKPTPWDAEACTKSARVNLPANAETKRPSKGYRLEYLIAGDFDPLLSFGKALELAHPEVRTTMLPVLKNDFLYSVEFDGFKGGQIDLTARTNEVCRLVIEQNVKIIGWQLIDGNKIAAGAYEVVGQ